MSDASEAGEDEEISLSVRQVLLAVVFGILVMYFSATGTLYFQQPPAERSVFQLVYPFERGPSAETLHRKGVQHFQDGKYGEATQFFARSLKKDSDNAKALFLLASAQAKQGHFDRALSQLELLEGGGFGLDRIPIKKAYWLLGLGRYEEARRAARNFVDRPSPSDQNKVYGYLILYTVARKLKGDPTPEQIRSEAESLEGVSNRWPMLLFQRLVDGKDETSSSFGDRARETEFRAWKAVFSWMEGRETKARKHREWIRREGDSSLYEYDLMLATRVSDLFGRGY